MTQIFAKLMTICIALLASGASAQGTSVAFGALQQDTSLPVELTSDALSIDQTSGVATFEGNVLIGQGEMRLSAQTVRVTYNATNTGIDKLAATGGVTLISGADAAEADRADYDIDGGVIVLSGSVLMTQGANALTSQRMSIDLSDGTANLSGRVKTVLQSGGTD